MMQAVDNSTAIKDQVQKLMSVVEEAQNKGQLQKGVGRQVVEIVGSLFDLLGL